MITDPDRFKHNRSHYERPNARHRCGREAHWQKPCWQGPNPDGSCGGTAECSPARTGEGNYQCRRPPHAGGPCSEGPLPDGTCTHKRPPCLPALNLRGRRGRAAVLTLALAVSVIGVFMAFPRANSMGISPVNPGPLSAKHARFAGDAGCVSCHEAHQGGFSTWIGALFKPADMSTQCLSCHTFEGPALSSHNRIFAGRTDLQETQCSSCHTEHRGVSTAITQMSDAQCHTCHQVKFSSFSRDHPEFGADYPHDERMAIKFDHATHFSRYFKDKKFLDRAPTACAACHYLDKSNGRHVPVAGFETTCSKCHSSQITQKDLVLFRLPEMLVQNLDAEKIADVCGADAGTAVAALGVKDGYESVSLEEPTEIMAHLLGTGMDDPEDYQGPTQTLIQEMAADGLTPLAELLDERGGAGTASSLLAGLSPELVREVACTWAQNLEYESPHEKLASGWFADYLELRYKPAGHADPVMKNWVDFGLRAESSSEDMRAALLSSNQGGGRCTKCHAVTESTSAAGDKSLAVEWALRGPAVRDHTQFNHAVHMNLLQGETACLTCHVMDPEADFSVSFESSRADQFVSSFKAISKDTCTQCHGAKSAKETGSKVRDNCLLCHTYHHNPTLSHSMEASVGGANIQSQREL
ncbi:MAG: cytochrome c3 family protein [Candidatus Omnitrophota bacterium]|nr:cytochrome c3 family protein [Candidatus Omnitrophota bacterium]